MVSMSTNIIKRCSFCGMPLKLVGSKQRGNQHYLHEYNNNCILKGFGFKATDENIEHWNTRKPMENIVERLEERINIYKNTLDANFPAVDMSIKETERIIEIVKEEGGVNA